MGPMNDRGSEGAGAQRILLEADADSERMAAIIRVAIFAAILTAMLVAQSAGYDHRPLVMATAIYGMGTALSLVVAWRAGFRPWVPYAFVAMDVVALALGIRLLARLMEVPDALAPTLPVGGLVIVVLLHASMHHRPALVAFGGAVFVVSLVASSLLPAPAIPVTNVKADPIDHLAHFRIFPIAVFLLACVILVVTTRRTRRFINDAFAHASRAATLSRYFSPQVAEELTRQSEKSGSFGNRMNVAVIFADMRGFTQRAEAMDPALLTRFLSEFRTRIAAPAIEHGGVVDKYIGDAIMVVFGAPIARADDARRALRCAIRMLEAVEAWSEQLTSSGATGISVGVGAHWGSAFAGVLSDGRQLEYTVIGDTVNVASRLADLRIAPASQLVVSEELVQAAGGLPEPYRWRRLSDQTLPGHPRTIAVHLLSEVR